MRLKSLHVWLLIACLLAGRFVLPAHDVLHVSAGAADTCVACVHGGDPVAAVASADFGVLPEPGHAPARVQAPHRPALRPLRRFLGRAPPASLV